MQVTDLKPIFHGQLLHCVNLEWQQLQARHPKAKILRLTLDLVDNPYGQLIIKEWEARVYP